ncbi:MAG: Hint domain-containing protein [Pseudotabrizicola sp.]|uniref:Hint domain-containing protein n=1 Tax=Pseudotabrizicola sp. TaxID=2939647 RepID=UPI002731DCB5|nr:Hint domain-containing protein [Pseudotabrizicola sp.]MDZ7575061.1 Hint domain-containing protein [Pseudotabrizicola sp.]
MDYYVRTDSSTAGNAELNLTGAPSFQITFVAQTPSGDPGDLWLEGAPDPTTQVMINGQLYSFSVNWTATLPTTNNQGANQVPTQFRGDEIMRIAVQDYPSPGSVTYLAFMPYEQATAAEMNAFGNGAIAVQNVNTSPDPVPVCYVGGTRLEGVDGAVAVEDLRAGDLIMTRDSGPQPIRWIGWSEHRWPGTDEKLRPVRIPARSMDGQLPYRDLMISPQHRILLCKESFAFVDTDEECFAPALSFEGYRGVERDTSCQTVRYYHVLLDRHSVLTAEGLLSESFFPGPVAMRNLSFENRIQVMTMFPNLAKDPEAGYGRLCRRTLTKRQAVAVLFAATA